MTVYKCDWPGHSWPIGHYWILGCLLQSTLVGLKSSQSQKLVIVFFGDIHKNHRDNNHNSSNSSKCRSFFHNQHCWGRLLLAEIQEGMMEVSIGPSGRCLSWSGVAWTWVTFLWDFPTWIFNPFSDLKVFRHWSDFLSIFVKFHFLPRFCTKPPQWSIC